MENITVSIKLKDLRELMDAASLKEIYQAKYNRVQNLIAKTPLNETLTVLEVMEANK